jgi:hypothetical protein
VGLRGTYYADSGTFEDRIVTTEVESTVPGEPARIDTTTVRELNEHGSVFRTAINAGFEASFKMSRAWEQAQSRRWGLDGLRHIIQPFTNFSYVYSDKDPVDLLQFDRLNRSTQLPPIDFPQFNTIDSIDNWTILRLGVRNRLQTRRDNRTVNWFELNTYFDINFDRPEFVGGVIPDPGTFSNVFNSLRWAPLPWVTLAVDSATAAARFGLHRGQFAPQFSGESKRRTESRTPLSRWQSDHQQQQPSAVWWLLSL